MWHFISENISKAQDFDFICDDIRQVSGGDTHSAYKISDGRRRFFVKVNQADALPNFASEAVGLRYLSHSNSIRIPRYICHGVAANKSYLVLEHITLSQGDTDSWRELGQQLAQLHQTEQNSQYGLEKDNYIGQTPQDNHWQSRWGQFFAEQRIGNMLERLATKGIRFVDIDTAIDSIKVTLKEHAPEPCLVHGDLWAGNVGFNKKHPVIYDPAPYFGDRETDIAMTELFSRFPDAFYQGYNQQWPLDKGYAARKPLYQLYHVLNHALMFGGSYLNLAKTGLGALDARLQ